MRLPALLITLAGIWCATPALARSHLDPELERYLGASRKAPPIRVIVIFKRGFEPRSGAGPQEVREQLEQRLERGSARAKKILGDSRHQIEPLWLFNGWVLEIPAKKLRELRNDRSVAAIYSTEREAGLIEPLESAEVPRERLRRSDLTWGMFKIEMHSLWARFPELIGKDVHVGVLDTGIDPDHPDLKGKVAAWKDLFQAAASSPYDDHGHGTHVSGTIAGSGTSGTMIGIASGARLTVGKAFDHYGSSKWETLMLALQWMADPDGDPKTDDFPAIVNNSWGVGLASPKDDPKDSPFCEAVLNWRRLGILPVFAAGNIGPSKETVNLPAACPGALAVGATDITDAVPGFSSRGPAKWKTGTLLKPDLVAPGTKVISAAPGGKYKELTGTSMATPHVSGLAALMLQRRPDASVDELIESLTSTAHDLSQAGPDDSSGNGRLNALEAVLSIRP